MLVLSDLLSDDCVINMQVACYMNGFIIIYLMIRAKKKPRRALERQTEENIFSFQFHGIHLDGFQ